MSLTRAQVEGVLIKRTGQMLAIAGLDGETADGSNADLNDPIGWAVRKLGGSVADVSSVANSDLENIKRVDALFDLGELRVLETILGNYDKVDSTVGPRREEYDDLAQRLLKWLPEKRKQIEHEHDISLGDLKKARFQVWGGPGARI